MNKYIREKINDEHVRKRAKKEAKHAFLYMILSTIWTIVDCCVFLVLTWLWLPIIPSNIIMVMYVVLFPMIVVFMGIFIKKLEPEI